MEWTRNPLLMLTLMVSLYHHHLSLGVLQVPTTQALMVTSSGVISRDEFLAVASSEHEKAPSVLNPDSDSNLDPNPNSTLAEILTITTALIHSL